MKKLICFPGNEGTKNESVRFIMLFHPAPDTSPLKKEKVSEKAEGITDLIDKLPIALTKAYSEDVKNLQEVLKKLKINPEDTEGFLPSTIRINNKPKDSADGYGGRRTKLGNYKK